MIQLLFFLLMCTLVSNLAPLVNVAVILAFIPLYFLARPEVLTVPAGQPAHPEIWLKAAYCYWISSYFLFTGSISNFLSFEFLRRDGAILFGYLPLFLFCEYGLDREFVRRLVSIFLSLMAAVALLGAVQFADAVGILSSGWLPMPVQFGHSSAPAGHVFYGLFQAHNAAGAVYAIAALLSLAVLVFDNDGKPRVFALPTCWTALNLLGLAMTKSRGAYVGVAIATLVMLFDRLIDVRRAGRPLLLIIVPLLTALVLQPDIATRMSSITSGEEDPNVVERLAYWSRAITYIQQSPIVGVGFGRYNDEALQFWGVPGVFYPAVGGEIVNDDKHAHNSYLHFLAEGGIVGLALMVEVWISVFRWARWAGRICGDVGVGQALARTVQASVVLLFWLSLTEHQMNSAATTIVIFALFGLMRNLVFVDEASFMLASSSPA